jgi:hypothetical protein
MALLLVPAVGVPIADALNPQWDAFGTMASHYVNGRAGWIVPTSLLAMGIASAILTIRSPLKGPGRWLLGVWSAGVLVAAVAPADPPGGWDRPPSMAGTVHGVGGLLAFLVLPVAAAFLARTPALRLAAGFLAVTALTFWIFWLDVLGGPSLSVAGHPSLVGAVERLLLLGALVWLATFTVSDRRLRDREG